MNFVKQCLGKLLFFFRACIMQIPQFSENIVGFQKIPSEDFTGGIYVEGESDIDIMSLQGGYLLPMAPVELVVGRDTIDAEGYDRKWARTSVGVNWYWDDQNAKVQAIYRSNSNMNGVEDQDQGEVIVQFQFLFE